MKNNLIAMIMLAFSTTLAAAGDVTGQLPSGVKPENSIVFLQGSNLKGQVAPLQAEIDQENLKFVPHLLAVTVGSTVTFKNSDSVTHNVFGVGAETFNLGTWNREAEDNSHKKKLTRPGEVAILCNVHPEMSAYIYVLDNPYFTRPEASGSYKIDNVPPGDYTLVIYQPEHKPIKKKVHVG